MRNQIQARLNELKRQLEVGQTELQQVLVRENYLRETILRISGAIQVLEELLTEQQPTGQDETGSLKVEPIAVQTNPANA